MNVHSRAAANIFIYVPALLAFATAGVRAGFCVDALLDGFVPLAAVPETLPGTLAYLESVGGIVYRVLALPQTGVLVQVDYFNSTGAYTLQTQVVRWATGELVTECDEHAGGDYNDASEAPTTTGDGDDAATAAANNNRSYIRRQ
jgi:hypothetical protein